MGAYRSKPITDKVSSDDSGNYVKCGASSMQGWRVTQEDAHNCIIEYDESTSFFAVYDGHGSHEVAIYCSRKLPDYLKDCASYKSGEYTKALKDAYLGFDATLVEPKVVKLLKQIAKDENEETDENQNSGSEDEENIRNLYEEAQMPLEEVIAKYQADGAGQSIKVLGVTPPSPYVVAKQASRSKVSSEAGSSKAGRSDSAGCSSSSLDVPDSSSALDTEVNSSGDGGKDIKSETTVTEGEDKNESPGTSTETNGEKNLSEDNEDSESKIEKECSSVTVMKTENEKDNETEDDDITQIEGTSHLKVTEDKEINEVKNIEENVPCKDKEEPDKEKDSKDSETKSEVNGKVEKDNMEPHENGDVASEDTEEEDEEDEEDKILKTLKGKGKAILKKLECSKRQSARQRSVAILFRSLLAAQEADTESEDDDGDESYPRTEDSSSNEDEGEKDGSTEDVDGEEEEETEDEDEEGEEEEEEELDDDDVKGVLDPGVESGCTAVVALLHGRDLYVANAGDSRCIVSRAGEALDMSLDHKPEDAIEKQRIVAAGGYVSRDGRVKGGLNLSRAIGDHTYKRTENLPPEEQMITALPDVRTLSLDPKQDEFMILACDGIWNSMTSQEVVSFVRTRLQSGDKKLSTICEELFEFCLAPNTLDDESGCDNMTAVIIQFLPTLADACSCDLPDTSLSNASNKRPASPVEDLENAAKRIKTEGE